MKNSIKEFEQLIAKSSNIVIMTGAGVSTNSGIPDYRSEEGLYKNKEKPEYMLSIDCWEKEYIKFINFIITNFDFSDKKPNYIHEWIVNLEKHKDVTVITQNVDNLHQKAGTKNVINYHGNVNKWTCVKCKKEYTFKDIHQDAFCSHCGSKLKSNIVLYGQNINFYNETKSISAIRNADLLIVIGTSLAVFPFCLLIEDAKESCKKVLLNKTDTQNYNDIFDIKFLDDAEKTLKKVDYNNA